jgi:hypothetical protein
MGLGLSLLLGLVFCQSSTAGGRGDVYLESNVMKINEYLDEQLGRQFYIKDEIARYFTNFTVSLALDFVEVSNTRKPEFGTMYPAQEFEQPTEYNLNKLALINSFRQGYVQANETFAATEQFPYRSDNKAVLREKYEVLKDI